MGLRILQGVERGDSNGYAVLYCSTSMSTLPWMFEGGTSEAEAFMERYGDVRRLSDVEQQKAYDAWVRERMGQKRAALDSLEKALTSRARPAKRSRR